MSLIVLHVGLCPWRFHFMIKEWKYEHPRSILVLLLIDITAQRLRLTRRKHSHHMLKWLIWTAPFTCFPVISVHFFHCILLRLIYNKYSTNNSNCFPFSLFFSFITWKNWEWWHWSKNPEDYWLWPGPWVAQNDQNECSWHLFLDGSWGHQVLSVFQREWCLEVSCYFNFVAMLSTKPVIIVNYFLEVRHNHSAIIGTLPAFKKCKQGNYPSIKHIFSCFKIFIVFNVIAYWCSFTQCLCAMTIHSH